jgi:hypothetical protein
MEGHFNLEKAHAITDGRIPGRIYTRDGYPVRIICWDAAGSLPIVGLVEYDSFERAEHYTADGKNDIRRNVTTPYDLITIEQ